MLERSSNSECCSGSSCGSGSSVGSDDGATVHLPLLVPERFAAPATRAAPPGQRWRQLAVCRAAAVVAACIGWVGVSAATILINKHIMVDLTFHFPATVAALGMLGTSLASFIVCVVLRLAPCRATVSPYFFFTRVLATGFFTAVSFQAGNTAYLYLSVAFVQMLKAFTPVTTMLFGFALRLERPSVRLAAAVALICCGVAVSSLGELNFSALGVAAMLTSICAEGLRIVLMQHLLAAKQFSPIEAWMYLGPACCVWLLLIIGLTEAHHISDQHGLEVAAAHPAVFACAAAAGFAVNALAMLVIQLASALSLKVLGICKDVGLVALGTAALGEHISALQVGGYCVSLVGFGAYNYMKAAGAAGGGGGGGGAAVAQDGAGRAAAAAAAAAAEATAVGCKQPLPRAGGGDGTRASQRKMPRIFSPLRRKPGLIGTAMLPASADVGEPLLPRSLLAS